jgi:hypothetical protein
MGKKKAAYVFHFYLSMYGKSLLEELGMKEMKATKGDRRKENCLFSQKTQL